MIVNKNPGPGHYFQERKRDKEQQKAPFGNTAPRLPPIGLSNVPGIKRIVSGMRWCRPDL